MANFKLFWARILCLSSLAICAANCCAQNDLQEDDPSLGWTDVLIQTSRFLNADCQKLDLGAADRTVANKLEAIKRIEGTAHWYGGTTSSTNPSLGCSCGGTSRRDSTKKSSKNVKGFVPFASEGQGMRYELEGFAFGIVPKSNPGETAKRPRYDGFVVVDKGKVDDPAGNRFAEFGRLGETDSPPIKSTDAAFPKDVQGMSYSVKVPALGKRWATVEDVTNVNDLLDSGWTLVPHSTSYNVWSANDPMKKRATFTRSGRSVIGHIFDDGIVHSTNPVTRCPKCGRSL